MIAVLTLALRRQYRVDVVALRIIIFRIASAVRSATGIFLNINVPVISVVLSYTGVPPDDIAGRVVTFYERSVISVVDQIEHIESQSIPNYGIIKMFFQHTANIDAALAKPS
jgi:multidrug efflux pump subunit AcrB